jgi:hypothetical protein
MDHRSRIRGRDEQVQVKERENESEEGNRRKVERLLVVVVSHMQKVQNIKAGE